MQAPYFENGLFIVPSQPPQAVGAAAPPMQRAPRPLETFSREDEALQTLINRGVLTETGKLALRDIADFPPLEKRQAEGLQDILQRGVCVCEEDFPPYQGSLAHILKFLFREIARSPVPCDVLKTELTGRGILKLLRKSGYLSARMHGIDCGTLFSRKQIDRAFEGESPIEARVNINTPEGTALPFLTNSLRSLFGNVLGSELLEELIPTTQFEDRESDKVQIRFTAEDGCSLTLTILENTQSHLDEPSIHLPAAALFSESAETASFRLNGKRAFYEAVLNELCRIAPSQQENPFDLLHAYVTGRRSLSPEAEAHAVQHYRANKEALIPDLLKYLTNKGIQDPHRGLALAYQASVIFDLEDREVVELWQAVWQALPQEPVRLKCYDFFSQVCHLVLFRKVPFRLVHALTTLAGYYDAHSLYSFSRENAPAAFRFVRSCGQLRLKGTFCAMGKAHCLLFSAHPDEAAKALAEAQASRPGEIKLLKPLYETMRPMDPLDPALPIKTAPFMGPFPEWIPLAYKLLNSRASFIRNLALHSLTIAHVQTGTAPNPHQIMDTFPLCLAEERSLVTQRVLIANMDLLLNSFRQLCPLASSLNKAQAGKDFNTEKLYRHLIEGLINRPLSAQGMDQAEKIFTDYTDRLNKASILAGDAFSKTAERLGQTLLYAGKTAKALFLLGRVHKSCHLPESNKAALALKICAECAKRGFISGLSNPYIIVGDIAVESLRSMHPSPTERFPEVAAIVEMQLYVRRPDKAAQLLILAEQKRLIHPGDRLSALAAKICISSKESNLRTPEQSYSLWKQLSGFCESADLGKSFLFELARELHSSTLPEKGLCIAECLEQLDANLLSVEERTEFLGLWKQYAAKLLDSAESGAPKSLEPKNLSLSARERQEFDFQSFHYEFAQGHFLRAWAHLQSLPELKNPATQKELTVKLFKAAAQARSSSDRGPELDNLLCQMLQSEGMSSFASEKQGEYLKLAANWLEESASHVDLGEQASILESCLEKIRGSRYSTSESILQRLAGAATQVLTRHKDRPVSSGLIFELEQSLATLLCSLQSADSSCKGAAFLVSCIKLLDRKVWKNNLLPSIFEILDKSLERDRKMAPMADKAMKYFRKKQPALYPRERFKIYSALALYFYEHSQTAKAAQWTKALSELNAAEADPGAYKQLIACATECFEHSNDPDLALQLHQQARKWDIPPAKQHTELVLRLLARFNREKKYTSCLEILVQDFKSLAQSSQFNAFLGHAKEIGAACVKKQMTDEECRLLHQAQKLYGPLSSQQWPAMLSHTKLSRSPELRRTLCQDWIGAAESLGRNMPPTAALECWQACTRTLAELADPLLAAVLEKRGEIQDLAAELKSSKRPLGRFDKELLRGCLRLLKQSPHLPQADKMLEQMLEIHEGLNDPQSLQGLSSFRKSIDFPLIKLLILSNHPGQLEKAAQMLLQAVKCRSSSEHYEIIGALLRSLISKALSTPGSPKPPIYDQLLELSEKLREGAVRFPQSLECALLFLYLPHERAFQEAANLMLFEAKQEEKQSTEKLYKCLRKMNTVSRTPSHFAEMNRCLSDKAVRNTFSRGKIASQTRAFLMRQTALAVKENGWSNGDKKKCLELWKANWQLFKQNSPELQRAFEGFLDLLIHYLAVSDDPDGFDEILHSAVNSFAKKQDRKKSGRKARARKTLKSSGQCAAPMIQVIQKFSIALAAGSAAAPKHRRKLYFSAQNLIEQFLLNSTNTPKRLVFRAFQDFCRCESPAGYIRHCLVITEYVSRLCEAHPGRQDKKALSNTLMIVADKAAELFDRPDIDEADLIPVLEPLYKILETRLTKEICFELLPKFVFGMSSGNSKPFKRNAKRLMKVLCKGWNKGLFSSDPTAFYLWGIHLTGVLPAGIPFTTQQKESLITVCVEAWIETGSFSSLEKAAAFLGKYKSDLQAEYALSLFKAIFTEYRNLPTGQQILLFLELVKSTLPLSDFSGNHAEEAGRSLGISLMSLARETAERACSEPDGPRSEMERTLHIVSYYFTFAMEEGIFNGHPDHSLQFFEAALTLLSHFDDNSEEIIHSKTVVTSLQSMLKQGLSLGKNQKRFAECIKIWFFRAVSLYGGKHKGVLRELLTAFQEETELFKGLDEIIGEIEDKLE